MSIQEEVFSKAVKLAGTLAEGQEELLQTLSAAAAAGLEARLREGVTAEDCREVFVTAASFLAVSALEDCSRGKNVREFRAGDLTVKEESTSGTSARNWETQARMLMGPYLRDSFCFLGV